MVLEYGEFKKVMSRFEARSYMSKLPFRWARRKYIRPMMEEFVYQKTREKRILTYTDKMLKAIYVERGGKRMVIDSTLIDGRE